MRKLLGIFCLLILIIIFIYLYKNKSAAFYNNIGADLSEKGSYGEAITYFKKSIAILPGNYLTHLNLANAYKSLAKIYMQEKMYPDAITELKNGLSFDPTNNEIKELLSEISFKAASDYSAKGLSEFLAGNKKTAYALMSNAITLDANSAYAHYLLAYFYYADQNFNKAIAEIEKIIKLDSRFGLANKLLGDIYFDSGNYLQAIEQYKLALAVNNNDYILYNNISLAFVQLERYHEALTYIKKASELSPANPNISYTLASIYRDNSMLEQSLLEYDKLSDYPNIHNDKAGIYMAQGKKKQAFLEYSNQIKDCNHKLSVNSNDMLSLNNLANAYIGIEDYNKAETAINRAINIAPNYRQNYLTLANIQKHLGNYTDASKTLEKAYLLADTPKFKIINTDISNIKNAPQPFMQNRALIYLKNGRVLEGIIKSETAEKVVLEVEIGISKGDMILYHGTIARILKAKK